MSRGNGAPGNGASGNGNGATGSRAPGSRPPGLGTFGGVFVPNVLTILGVILFMRTGWVVGTAGFWGAMGILVIANTITLMTALSLSALSTNTQVGAGGAYFITSRSLGVEIGGSIGVPLYFAQAISVAFYLVGFAESLDFILPGQDQRLVCLGVLVCFMGIAWFGAGVIAKTQYLILAALIASLISVFAGFRPIPDLTVNLAASYAPGQDFWLVFAIFFPAVTGIMAGVSMSGDLANPSKAIPRGTVGAVVATFFIYAAAIALLAFGAERQDLLQHPLIMQQLAAVGPLVIVGLWAATLSSALASLAAAPRTLQALASDQVVPGVLGRRHGANREPRVALVVSTLVAGGCVLIGELDLIAPIISMFFLATYGTLNIVAGLEALVGNPSYRPTFRVHWSVSIIGGLGCVAVMCLIDPLATAASVIVIFGIYVWLTRRRLSASWGDMRSGMWFAATRFALLRFESSQQHLRNWRPVVLVLAGNPHSRQRMISFADWIEAGSGFLFLAQVVIGELDQLLPKQARLQDNLRAFIRDKQLSAAARTVVAENFENGVLTLLQVTGLGEFEPNTVLMGWSEDVVKRDGFLGSVNRILNLKRNLLVYAEADAEDDPTIEAFIDVWWYHKDNGSFMLTLAYLIRSNHSWANHRIRVRRVVRNAEGKEGALEHLRKQLGDYRITSEPDVIVSEEPAMDVIAEASERSAITFVGIPGPTAAIPNPLIGYESLIGRLRGDVFLCKSWHVLEN